MSERVEIVETIPVWDNSVHPAEKHYLCGLCKTDIGCDMKKWRWLPRPNRSGVVVCKDCFENGSGS